MIADADGPSLGGLFLAFPAIFFASATLIEKHERERKAEKGMLGVQRGRAAAALDAAGAGWGSIGLPAFAFTMWRLATTLPLASLMAASPVWLVSGLAFWRLRRELRRRPR